MAKRRIRQQLDDELDTLLGSLSLDELRTAMGMLDIRAAANSIVDATNALKESGRAVKDVITALHRVEMLSPRKHCWFGTLRGDSEAVKQVFHRRAEPRDADGDLRLAYAEKSRDERAAYFVLEQTLTSTEWRRLEGKPRLKEQIDLSLRHAVTVRIDLHTSRVMLTFPGLPPNVDVDEEDVVDAAADVLGELGIEVDPLPVRGCISALMQSKGRRVVPVRGDIDTELGVVKVRSKSKMTRFEQVVVGLLRSGKDILSEKNLVDQVTKNLGENASFETVGLVWTEENVYTRVRLLRNGADFLFVWGRTAPTYLAIDQISGILFDLRARFESQDFATVWRNLEQLEDGECVFPNDFNNRFTVPVVETERAVREAVRAGFLEPVYQLKADTDFLEEIEHTDWTKDLRSLCRVFSSGDRTIDGTNPKNIRVAFRRLRAWGAKEKPA